MATSNCLHCHLIDAMNEWSDEHGDADRVDLVHHAARFLADLMVSVTDPGKDRISCTNNALVSLALMMSKRKDEVYPHKEDGAPEGVSKH